MPVQRPQYVCDKAFCDDQRGGAIESARVVVPSRSRGKTISRLQKLSSLACFALRSPALFARASQEGLAFVLDRALIHSSPLPILPNSTARKLYAVEVQSPPQGFL